MSILDRIARLVSGKMADPAPRAGSLIDEHEDVCSLCLLSSKTPPVQAWIMGFSRAIGGGRGGTIVLGLCGPHHALVGRHVTPDFTFPAHDQGEA
jgi:hypothetical protein